MNLLDQIKDAGIIGAGGAGFRPMQNSHQRQNTY